MIRRPSSASIYAVLGSVAVHALVALWCALHEPPARTVPRGTSTVEFALVEPSVPAAVSASTPDESPERSPAKPSRARSAPKHSAPQAPPPVAEMASSPAEAPSAAAPPAASPAVEAARAPRVLDLSPLAAALTLRDSLTDRGRCEARLADAAACKGGGEDAGAAVQAGTAGDVRAELAGLRKELQLKPERDGSYSFDGPSFRASVAADGRVTFHDKIQDLNTLVERHLVGSQINTSEKRRFMESTAELRERLAVAAEAQNQRRAQFALQAALRRIVAEQGTSLLAKRRALFALWDDCAADAGGLAAQALIEAFVREQLPEGSALGYSAAELAQLNRGRISRRPFDPYAAPDAGVRPG